MTTTHIKSELPAGYLDLGTCAMHVAQLRKHTSDLERFKHYIPLMLELDGVETGTPEAYAIYERADNLEQLALSLQEFGALNIAEAKKLQDVIAARKSEGGAA